MNTQLHNLLIGTKVLPYNVSEKKESFEDIIHSSFNLLKASDEGTSQLRISLMSSLIKDTIKLPTQIDKCDKIDYHCSINSSNLDSILPLSVWKNPPTTSNLFASYELKKQELLNKYVSTSSKQIQSENNSKKVLNQQYFSSTASYMDTRPVYLKRKNNIQDNEDEDVIDNDSSFSSYQNSIYNIKKKKNRKNNYNNNKQKRYYQQDVDEDNEEDNNQLLPQQPKPQGFQSAITISNKVLKNNISNDQGYNKQYSNINEDQTSGDQSGCKKFVPPAKKDTIGTVKKSIGNDKGDEKEKALDEKLKGFDKKMIEFIQSEILTSSPNVSWDDIAGLEFAKKTIKEIIIWPLLRPDLFNGIRRPPKGLLLFGPPGTGKTMIAKAIASQSHSQFFNISASSLMSKWIGDSEKLVRTLFALASFYQPSVVFIDEIDSILTARSENECEASRRIKTEFLVQLDGAGTNADDRILIIGATNRPQEIDDAFIRRLSKRLYIPLPNKMSRRQLINSVLRKEQEKNNKYDITEKDIEMIISMTKGYSGSDMISVCREAAMMPIRSIDDISNLQVDQLRSVSVDDFKFSIENVKPSVSDKTIGQYVQWNHEFGSFQFEDKDE